jgi:hypothetical protein
MQHYSDTLAYDIRNYQIVDSPIYDRMDLKTGSDSYRFDNQQHITCHRNGLYLNLKYKKRK